ncbi:MAG: hypothetical protein AABX24_02550 [Nanoarchaeota archaeon]
MNKQKKIRNLKKRFRNMAACALVGAAGLLCHSKAPTTIPGIYYNITDSYTNTATEQRIEQKFKIDYEGTSKEDLQKSLEWNLQMIYNTNPFLISHCKKMVLFPETVENSPFIKPFLDYEAVATWPWSTIELNNTTDIGTIAHELAHLTHRAVPREFDVQLDLIFGDSYNKDIKKRSDNVLVWEDNTGGPKNGFVGPYGATGAHENVATYVDAAYQSYYWEDVRFQQSDKYLKTLSLLSEYNFIAPRQFEEIKHTLEYNRPLKKILRTLDLEVRE